MALSLQASRIEAGRADPAVAIQPPLPTTGTAAAWPLRRQLTTVTVGWMFGAIWFNVTNGAPLTLFAKGLGATPLQFGILAALPYVAALFSVLGSLVVESTGERKRVFLDAHYIQRSLWFVIATVPLAMVSWYGPAASPRAVTVFLGLMCVMYACGATGGPAWVSWMADVVPHRIRGAFFARRRQWGIVTAVPAALLVGAGIDRLAGGTCAAAVGGVPPIVFWCAALFLVTAFFGLADIAAFQHLPHKAKPAKSGAALLKSMAAPLRDKPFMALSGFVGALNFTVGFTNQFATLYVIDRLKVDAMHVQLMLLVAPMALQLLVLPTWGAAVDKVGRRPMLILAAAGLVPMAFGWCLVGQEMPWLGYVLYAGGAALWTGVDIANFNYVLDRSGGPAAKAGQAKKAGQAPAGGSGYHAVNTVIINVCGCAGGLAAGAIAQGLGGWSWQPIAGFHAADFYQVLFVFSGVVRVASLVVIAPLLHEPTAKSVTEAAKFMVTFTAARLAAQAAAAGRWVARRRDEVAASQPGVPALEG